MLDARFRNLVQNHMINSQFCQTQTPQDPHGRELPDLAIQGHLRFSKSTRIDFGIITSKSL